MKYQIYYSCPNDIQRYTMSAKDENQLATFIKMWAKDEKQLIKLLHILTNEQAYNFSVEVINYD